MTYRDGCFASLFFKAILCSYMAGCAVFACVILMSMPMCVCVSLFSKGSRALKVEEGKWLQLLRPHPVLTRLSLKRLRAPRLLGKGRRPGISSCRRLPKLPRFIPTPVKVCFPSNNLTPQQKFHIELFGLLKNNS